MASNSSSSLFLGWKVTKSLDPRYWVSDPKPKAGSQDPGDLVTVRAEDLATHTAIIAQSGSGKSFLLGRLVEEILVATKARCLVLDPNGDFRRADEVTAPNKWTEATYDRGSASGWLPHEAKGKDFSDRWSRVSKVMRRAWNEPPPQPDHIQPLKLWFPSLTPELLGDFEDPLLENSLYHCHRFGKAMAELAKNRCIASADCWSINRLLNAIAESFDFSTQFTRHMAELRDTGPVEAVSKSKFPDGSPAARCSPILVSKWCAEAEQSRAHVGPAKDFYPAKLRELQQQGLFFNDVCEALAEDSGETTPSRLEVIDLPGLEERVRPIAVGAVLQKEWERARRKWEGAIQGGDTDDQRVPTFVVVDEAHNFVPANPQGKTEAAIRDQFRTIVAEGRKYGVFLILVSQRPDKLDPLVLSECENKLLMKLSTPSVLRLTSEVLGLDDIPPKALERCLQFEKGRGLLIGNWAPEGPEFFYCAARRTLEGGRNLRPEHWAAPE